MFTSRVDVQAPKIDAAKQKAPPVMINEVRSTVAFQMMYRKTRGNGIITELVKAGEQEQVHGQVQSVLDRKHYSQ